MSTPPSAASAAGAAWTVCRTNPNSLAPTPEFAATELPQQLHAAVIAATQSQRLIGHITRDSTAIEAREHVPQAVLDQKKANEETARKRKQARRKKRAKAKSQRQIKAQLKQKAQSQRQTKAKPKRKHTKGSFARAKATERGPRIQRQRLESLDQMLTGLPRHCDIGAKVNSQGNIDYNFFTFIFRLESIT